MWVYAAAQNFNSIGIGFGSLIAFASYSQKDAKILRSVIDHTKLNHCKKLVCLRKPFLSRYDNVQLVFNCSELSNIDISAHNLHAS